MHVYICVANNYVVYLHGSRTRDSSSCYNDQLDTTEITEYSLAFIYKNTREFVINTNNINMKTINRTTEGYLHNCRNPCVR